MIALLEVVRREVEERRLYLAGGLLLGLLPLLAPLLPWAAAQPAMEVREAMAVTLFWIASLVFSVLLGGAVFGSDLAERRLSFYFSRPLSGWAVLSGKLAATLLVGFTATALVLLPSVALGWRLPQFFLPWASAAGSLRAGEALGVWLPAVLVLLLVAHYVRTVALARSPWRLLDAAGLVAAFLALRWIARGLLGAQAAEAMGNALLPVGIGLLAGLFFGVAAQVLRGRTSVRRGHLLLSTTFWGVMGIALAAASGYAGWVLSAGPEDLEHFSTVRAAPAGDWLVVSGPAWERGDYHPAFLFRVSDGARLPLPAGEPRIFERSGSLLFSADGLTACWKEYRGAPVRVSRVGSAVALLPASELICARLDEPAPRSRATGIMVSVLDRFPDYRLAALSADGRRFAQVEGRLLTVEDVASRRLLISRRLPVEISSGELYFDRSGSNLVLLTQDWSEGTRLDVWRLEVATGELERRFRLEGVWRWSRDPLDERLLLREFVDGRTVRIWLADLAAAEIVQIEPPGAERLLMAAFLADGRMILQSEDSELWLANRDGIAVRRLPRHAGYLRLGGQPAPDSLLVSYTGRRGLDHRLPRTYLIELASGTERLVGDGLVPLSEPGDGPGGLGSRLLSRPGPPGWRSAPGPRGRELLLLDPVTLELRAVLAAR